MEKNIPVLEYRKELPYSKILIYFPGGSSAEDEKTQGFAHFCEHLVFKIKIDGVGVAEFVESRGGGCNAYTSNDAVVFEATVLNKFVPETVLFFENVFKKGIVSIEDTDFEEEKQVVVEEMSMYEDEPMENLFTTLMYNMFPSHKYGRKIIGLRDTITPSTKKNISDFMFKKMMMEPFAVVAGGFEKPCEIKLPVSNGEVKFSTTEKWSSVKRFETIHSQNKNYFIAGWRLPSQSGRTDAVLRMIYTIIYGMDGGRLYNDLVYDNAIFDNLSVNTLGFMDASLFVQSAAFPPDAVKKRIERWVRAWNDYRFSQSETARAREVILSGEYFSSEGLGSMPEIIGKSYMLYKDKDKLERDFFYEFMHLTAQDLNLFKNKYLDFDSLIWGIAKNSRSRVKVSQIFMAGSQKKENFENVIRTKKAGVKGSIRTVERSSFVSGYILKKSGVLGDLDGCPGSFKLFLDSLCTTADGMTREETESYLDRFGISLSPVCGNNTGGIKFTARDNFVQEAIDISLKILNNNISESDFEQERQYSIANMTLSEENPFFHIKRAVHRELFKGTPYQNTIGGTVEGLKSLNYDSILKIKENYFSRYPFCVSVTGAVDREILGQISQNLSRKDVRNIKMKSFIPYSLNEKIVKIPVKGRKQVYICRVFRGPAVSSSDYDTMRLIENYMTGQKSPYFQALREKQGLVYALDVSGMAGIIGGFALFSAITSRNKVDAVMKAIDDTVYLLKKGNIDHKHLEEVKNSMAANHANSIVKNQFHAFSMALEDALGQPFGNYLKYPEIIESITPDSIVECSKKYFNDGFWVIAN